MTANQDVSEHIPDVFCNENYNTNLSVRPFFLSWTSSFPNRVFSHYNIKQAIFKQYQKKKISLKMEKQALEKFQQVWKNKFFYLKQSCCHNCILEYISFILIATHELAAYKTKHYILISQISSSEAGGGKKSKVCKYFIHKHTYACILICKSVYYMFSSSGKVDSSY